MRAPWNRDTSWFTAVCHKSTGGGTTTTTQDSAPWSGQQQPLSTGFARAETDVLNRPLEYFPDSTVVPFSSQTEQALGAQESRALQGSPLLGQAQGYTGNVLGGQYLDPASNPFFKGTMDSIVSAIRPGVDSMFAGGGRAGSPLHAEALGRGVSRGAMPYLSNLYQQERGIMEGAAARAPGLAREDYYDPDRLAGVGAVREGKAEEGLAEEVARFNFAQSEPTARLAQYMGLIQGDYGGTSTGTSTAKQEANTGMLIAGTALRAAGMGK